MRGKDLLECIEQIDDALVEEAMDPAAVPCRDRTRESKNIFVKWGMAAACVIVIGVSATAFWSHQDIKEGQSGGVGDTAAPIAMTGSNNSTDSPSEGSLTAGAVAENAQADAAADSDMDSFDNSASSELCALPTAEEASRSDSGNDSVSRDSTADAASGAESTDVKDQGIVEELKLEKETAKLAYTIISDYYDEKEDSVYDYPVPGKGEFFCYHYLKETMEYYAEQEKEAGTADCPMYAYDVVIDIYGDIDKGGSEGTHYDCLSMQNNSIAGSDMIEQEYRRLSELGYAVRLSEDFQLTGTFTKEELDTFQASPEYGYTFRFANEY